MLCLKLSRIGKKGQPFFRLLVIEKSKDPWGNYLEFLGHYNPKSKKAVLKVERIKSWLAKGAKPTATVHNLLIKEKVIEGPKRRNIKISKKRLEKAKSKNKEPEKQQKIEEVKEQEKT